MGYHLLDRAHSHALNVALGHIDLLLLQKRTQRSRLTSMQIMYRASPAWAKFTMPHERQTLNSVSKDIQTSVAATLLDDH